MNSKVITLIVLLSITAIILRMRGNQDRIVPSEPLALVPAELGQWRGKDVPLADDVLRALGDGQFLNRTYRPIVASSQNLPVDLLIAYFPSQRSGQSIHSPQNCLPGAGWSFASSQRLTLTDASGKPHRVGEYLVTNGTATLEVLYWYRNRGRDIAGDYEAKGYLLLQAVRDRRTDGALIRVMTPVLPGEPQSAARARVTGFTAELDPLLSPFLPG